MATSDASQPMSTLAIRLIFEYEGDQVRLVSQQPVDVAITGFDIARTQRPGWHVDTRDAAGRRTRPANRQTSSQLGLHSPATARLPVLGPARSSQTRRLKR